MLPFIFLVCMALLSVTRSLQGVTVKNETNRDALIVVMIEKDCSRNEDSVFMFADAEIPLKSGHSWSNNDCFFCKVTVQKSSFYFGQLSKSSVIMISVDNEGKIQCNRLDS